MKGAWLAAWKVLGRGHPGPGRGLQETLRQTSFDYANPGKGMIKGFACQSLPVPEAYGNPEEAFSLQ